MKTLLPIYYDSLFVHLVKYLSIYNYNIILAIGKIRIYLKD